jgi:hypothetical protein
VEFLICFNQLAYFSFGFLFNSGYFQQRNDKIKANCLSFLRNVTIEHFLDKQLSSMLILKTETKFKRAISAKQFFAELAISKFKFRSNTIFVEASCTFTDSQDGQASGEVLLAYPLNFKA